MSTRVDRGDHRRRLTGARDPARDAFAVVEPLCQIRLAADMTEPLSLFNSRPTPNLHLGDGWRAVSTKLEAVEQAKVVVRAMEDEREDVAAPYPEAGRPGATTKVGNCQQRSGRPDVEVRLTAAD